MSSQKTLSLPRLFSPWLGLLVAGLSMSLPIGAQPLGGVDVVFPQPARPRDERAAASYRLTPQPSWVREVRLDEVDALPITPAALQLLAQDHQVQLAPGGGEAHYHHEIRRVQERAGLERGAQWEIEFDPSFQQLQIHRFAVWRQGQRIDHLPRLKVQMLQRETQLEQQIYDGRLTASIIQDDVRVGDRLELAYSLVGSNPVFAGRFVEQEWSATPRGPLAWVRYRVISPADGPALNWRFDPARYTLRRDAQGAWIDTTLERRNVPVLGWEANAPSSAYADEQIDVSQFADWAAVARWAEQLFASAQQAPLAAAVQQQAELLRRDTPEHTVAAVLDFVQGQIRYFGTEVGIGSHLPASPERVLSQRFGDCKDKVSLSLALLRHLGIEAVPLLASLTQRHDVPAEPPTPLAFNHVVLRVRVEGQIWVLDPTRSQQTGPLAERASFGLGRGLLAQSGATALLELPDARQTPRMMAQDVLRFVSFAQDPQLAVTWRYHGEMAESVRVMHAGENRADLERFIAGEYARNYPGAVLQGPIELEEVAGHNAVDVKLNFVLENYFKLHDDKLLRGDMVLPSLMMALRLPDPSLRSRALQLSPAGQYRHTLRLEFPEDVLNPIANQGEDRNDFLHVRWAHRLTSRVAEIEGDVQVTAEAVPAAAWSTYRDGLLKLWPRFSGMVSINTVAPTQATLLGQKAERLLAEVKQRRSSLATQMQVAAAVQLLVFDAQLDSQRLPAQPRARLLARRAVQLNSLGREEEAAQALAQSLALAPDDTDTLETAALNANLRGRQEEALAHADRVLQANPLAYWARMTRGRAHYELGRYAEARDDFGLAVQHMPEPNRGYAMIWQYLSQRRLGQSDATLGSLGDGDWPTPLMKALRGEISEAQARRAAQQRKDLAPGRLCELAYYLGELRAIEGDTRSAQRLFQQVLQTRVTEFVEFPLARRSLDRLHPRAR